MSIYLEIQPENIEPIEMSHFDMWFPTDDGEPDIDAYFNAEIEDAAEHMSGILEAWDKSLGTTLTSIGGDLYNDIEDLVHSIGLSMMWDLVVAQLLSYGYDVYQSDDFIEVYSLQPGEQYE